MKHYHARKILTVLLVLILLVLVAGTAVGWYTLNDVLGRHVPNSAERPSGHGLPYVPVSLTASDGTKLSAWYIAPHSPRAAAVLLPGLEDKQGGKTESFILDLAEFLYKQDIASLAMDTRGYGESGGEKKTLGIKEWQDALAGELYLTGLPELSGKPIGFIGDSMGGSVAIAAAARSGKGDFVIASVPLQNYRSAFRTWLKAEGYPTFVTPFVRLGALFFLGLDYGRYDTDKLIGNVHAPLLLIGAEKDEVVGTDIEALFARANEPKHLWKPVGSTHTLVDDMEDAYHKEVSRFLGDVINKTN